MKKILYISMITAFTLSFGIAKADNKLTTISFNTFPSPNSPELTVYLSSSDLSAMLIKKVISNNESIQVPSNLKIVAGGIYTPTSSGVSLLPQNCKIALANVNNLTISFNGFPTPGFNCTTN